MKTASCIVANGGWVTKEISGRPRARFFAGLSFLWLWVSAFASMRFWDGWPESFGIWDWLCGVLVISQAVFPVIAAVFWMTERPRIIAVECGNPDGDVRKLY
jgi:hypothetical protein